MFQPTIFFIVDADFIIKESSVRVLVCGVDSSVATMMKFNRSLFYFLFNLTQLQETNQSSFKFSIITYFCSICTAPAQWNVLQSGHSLRQQHLFSIRHIKHVLHIIRFSQGNKSNFLQSSKEQQ